VVSGILLGRALCDLSEERGHSCAGSWLVGAIGGALVMAIPGAVIGGQFRKTEREAD
jgi:hypothetical protein